MSGYPRKKGVVLLPEWETLAILGGSSSSPTRSGCGSSTISSTRSCSLFSSPLLTLAMRDTVQSNVFTRGHMVFISHEPSALCFDTDIVEQNSQPIGGWLPF